LGYGVAGAFLVGPNDDTWRTHYTSIVALDLADGTDLSFQKNNDEADTAECRRMRVMPRLTGIFLVFQVPNLESLVAAGGENHPDIPGIIIQQGNSDAYFKTIDSLASHPLCRLSIQRTVIPPRDCVNHYSNQYAAIQRDEVAAFAEILTDSKHTMLEVGIPNIKYHDTRYSG
jgi:hypothetical protein